MRRNKIYIGKTDRSLRERFGEHLGTIKKQTPGFPAAEQFSTNGHNRKVITIRSINNCLSIKQRKTTDENHLQTWNIETTWFKH